MPPLEINADFTRRVAVHAAQLPWVPSPMAGVERRMLDRIGDEVARATSIVRYAAGSRFSAHVHGGGEEFLVLEGVFQDETGDFPVGSYVRNPPTSRHTPRSDPGCTIFVKLWQFDPADRQSVRHDTRAARHRVSPDRPDVEAMELFADVWEQVRLERWRAAADVSLQLPGGGEILVLEGGFVEAGETFVRDSWLRLPAGAVLRARAGVEGARIWIKTGHLAAPALARIAPAVA